MRIILFYILAIWLVGCSSSPPKFTESDLIDKNIALLKSKKQNLDFSEKIGFNFSQDDSDLKATIKAIYRENGDNYFPFKLPGDGIDEFYIEPGLYKFNVMCRGTGGYAVSEINYEVRKGKRYEIACKIYEKDKVLWVEYIKRVKALIYEYDKTHNDSE